MNITKAIVILNKHTADYVVLHVDDKPSPMPNVTKETLDVMFHAEYDGGEKYVKANFPGVPYTVVPRPQ